MGIKYHPHSQNNCLINEIYSRNAYSGAYLSYFSDYESNGLIWKNQGKLSDFFNFFIFSGFFHIKALFAGNALFGLKIRIFMAGAMAGKSISA